MPPEEKTLREKAEALARRLQVLRVLYWAARCALVASAAALVLMLVHVAGHFEPVYLWSGGLMALALVVGLIWGALRKVTPLQAAAYTDERLGLKERLSSAIQFLAQPDTSGLVPALVTDAASTAERLEPARVYPYRATREAKYLGGAMLAFAALAFVPPLNLFMTPGEIAVKEEMKQQGKKITKVAKELERRAKEEDLKVSPELARRLAKLGRELEKARLTKKQALLETRALSEDIRKAHERMAQAKMTKKLKLAGKAMEGLKLSSKAGKALADALRGENLEQASKELGDLAAQLSSGELSAEEQKELTEDLGAMAQALSQAGLDEMAESLSEAAKSLDQGDPQDAAQQAEQAKSAAEELQKYLSDQEALEQMQQAMEQIDQQIKNADAPCPTCQGGG
ncbi:MAG: hypothetical protein ACE5R4_06860 [Armatimonadota bacterium]